MNEEIRPAEHFIRWIRQQAKYNRPEARQDRRHNCVFAGRQRPVIVDSLPLRIVQTAPVAGIADRHQRAIIGQETAIKLRVDQKGTLFLLR